MRQPSGSCEWCETHPYTVCLACNQRARHALALLRDGLAEGEIAKRMNLTLPRARRLIDRELDREDLTRYRHDSIPVSEIQTLIAEHLANDPTLNNAQLAKLAGHKSRIHFERVLGYAPHAATTKRGKHYPARTATTIDIETASQIVRALGIAPHEIPGL
jgi:hypothetical protein